MNKTCSIPSQVCYIIKVDFYIKAHHGLKQLNVCIENETESHIALDRQISHSLMWNFFVSQFMSARQRLS